MSSARVPPSQPAGVEEAPDSSTAAQLKSVYKGFYGVVANHNIDLDVRWGEIHALLGENGAGKSTLCSVLSGLYRPDMGLIMVDGSQVEFRSPHDALNAGIGMVYQHFRLVDRFTVAENLVLGHPKATFRLRRASVEREIGKYVERYGLAVTPDARIWQLSVGEQQRVEILKLLYRGVRILILDEPTAVLTPQESELLIKTVRALADEGKAVVFVSHKLDEVMEVSDRVTVLRDGRKVGEVLTSEANAKHLARMMVGRDFVASAPKVYSEAGETVLSIKGLRVQGDRGAESVRGVDLVVAKGQIIGIAGVSGNGQRELAEAIAGLRPSLVGQVVLSGVDISAADPLQRIESGFGYVPEDRLAMGLASGLSLKENLVLKSYRRPPFSKGPLMSGRAIEEHADQLTEEYDIRGDRAGLPVRLLSGGNLQRAILAREISESPKVLLAASPTRGLDFAATESIRELLLSEARKGMGILLISEDLDELRALADTILVMFEGEFVGRVEPSEFDPEVIGLMMAGLSVPETQ